MLDLDATDDPIHGHQLGRFFHGYYKKLLLPAAVHLLRRSPARGPLRPSDIDACAGSVKHLKRIVAQIREAWPEVKIVIRADSGFCREELLPWCEGHRVDYVIGLAKNTRLTAAIAAELEQARGRGRSRPARRPAASPTSAIRRSRPGAASGGWWPRRSTWPRRQPAVRGHVAVGRGSGGSSRCTRRTTAAAARWRTGSRSSSCTCSPTGPAPRRCGPTRSGCSSRRSPTCCWRRCGGWAWGDGAGRAQCQTIRLKLLKIGALVRVTVRRVTVADRFRPPLAA